MKKLAIATLVVFALAAPALAACGILRCEDGVVCLSAQGATFLEL